MRIFIIYITQTTRPNAVTRAPAVHLNEAILLHTVLLRNESREPMKLRLLRRKKGKSDTAYYYSTTV